MSNMAARRAPYRASVLVGEGSERTRIEDLQTSVTELDQPSIGQSLQDAVDRAVREIGGASKFLLGDSDFGSVAVLAIGEVVPA